ncbi:MAG TPA: hypothetical protein VG944_00685 [Fimbriimonas sp.]|nr:hypothetical protein [Fimbriimonas sp.]
MQKLFFAGVLALSAMGLVIAGCNSGDTGDGMKPENQKIAADANALAKKVGGDYNKLSPDEKQQFLKLANGNEAQAKVICNMMVHSPNEGIVQKHGGPVSGQ